MPKSLDLCPPYDVLCAGMAVADVPLRPVGPEVFDSDTTRLDGISLSPGGDAMNQAIALAGLGVRVALAAQVGSDPFGGILLKQAADRNVDITHVRINPDTQTSVSIVLIREDGRRSFVYCSGNNEHFTLEDVPADLWSRAKVVSLGSLLGMAGFTGEKAAEAFRRARAAGAVTVADTAFDINGQGLDGVRPVLPHTDYFVPSLEEAEALLGPGEPETLARKFLTMGAGHVMLKLGERGCLVMDAEHTLTLPAFRVPVIDTTGCGDHFTAGVILGILRGESPEGCARLGNAMGAMNAAQRGASARQHSLDALMLFMESRVTEG